MEYRTCNAVAALVVSLGFAGGLGCLDYVFEGERAGGAKGAFERPEDRRRTLRKVCRRVGEVTGTLRSESLEGWRIRICREGGCERTDPRSREVYVRRAGERASHEYVHVCLFASGHLDGHHAWMRKHCRFCHGSPACAGSCGGSATVE